MRSALLAGAALFASIPTLAYAGPDDAGDGQDKNVQTVVITAAPYAVSRDETPSIVTQISRDQIVAAGGSSIADSLASVPGISATGFATGASRPIIRGMDATRVRILEDGISSSDVSDVGPDHGIPIDPLSAQSIEVVRGASTLRYGSQAIGGVVNIINNRVPTTLPEKDFSGEALGSYDTVANMGEGAAQADVRAGQFAVHADGFYRDAQDYDTPLGTQANSYFRGHGASLGSSYFFGPSDESHVGGAIEQYNSNYGIPSDTTHIVMRQTKALGNASLALGSGLLKTLNVNVGYSEYTHDEVNPDGSIATTFRNKEFDGHAELLLNRIGLLENSAVGVEVQNRKFSAVGDDSSYLFPTTTNSVAGYAFAELPVTSTLHLQASGRVEHVRLQGTPASDVPTTVTYTPVSGAVGALLDVGTGVKLGFTASSTGRAPAITELFARGGHDGPNTYETGDPNLKIERANSLEATLRVHADRLHFEGSVYTTWFHNYIYGDLTGRTCDDDGVCSTGGDGDLKELFYRQQGAHFWGAEAQASYDVYRGATNSLSIKALGDATRAKLDDGSNVPRIPPYRLGGGFDWTGSSLSAGMLYIHAFRQDKFGAFDTATPAYDMLNANISWHPFASLKNLEFSIVGQNLTDSIQRNAAALNKDEVVAPGRNVRFVVKLATF